MNSWVVGTREKVWSEPYNESDGKTSGPEAASFLKKKPEQKG